MHAERVRIAVEAIEQDDSAENPMAALLEGALEITSEVTIDVDDD